MIIISIDNLVFTLILRKYIYKNFCEVQNDVKLNNKNSIFLTPDENIIAFDWLRFDRPHAAAMELIRKSYRYLLE